LNMRFGRPPRHNAERGKKVKCKHCREDVQLQDIPTWREIRLFGVTWIVGRWKLVAFDVCDACRIDEDREKDRRIFDAGVDAGVERASRNANR
jgi:hypothetical protein